MHEAGCSRLFRPFTIREIRKKSVRPNVRAFFVCTRSDLLSGEPARVLDIPLVQAFFVDRIPIPSIVSSGIITVWARICSHAWRCCPSGALMSQKHFSGYSIKFCLPQWCTPFFRVQPNTQWTGSSAGSTTAISATSSDRRRWPKRLRSSSNATDPAPRLHVYSRCEPSTDHPPGLSSGACPLLLGCTSGLRVTTGSPATLVLIGSNVV